MKNAQQLVAEAKTQVKQVTVQQLANVLRTKTATIAEHDEADEDGQAQMNALLIDVREPEEFMAGHVETSVNLPRGVLEMKLHQHPAVAAYSDADAALAALATMPLYLICRSGARSALAALSLQQMGFTQLYSVEGGFVAWVEAGFRIETSSST